MMDIFRPVLLVPVGIIVINLVAFIMAREESQRSAATRRRILRGSVIGIVIGLIVAFGSWQVLPTNRESPAMIITYLVSWVGGAAAILAGLTLIAAATARPSLE